MLFQKKSNSNLKMNLNNSRLLVLLTNVHERSALGAWHALEAAGIAVMPSTTIKGLRELDGKENIELHPCPITAFSNFTNWLKAKLSSDKKLLILPINEAIVYACDTIRLEHSELADRFIMPSHASLSFTLSKFNATRAAQKAGIQTPETFFIKDPSSLTLEIPKKQLQYPLILKWDNVLNTTGKYEKGSLLVVENKAVLEDAIAELTPSNCGIILQQMVPGQGVGAFFLRHHGKIVLRFAHRRLHEVPWTGGVSSYCESSDDADVLAAGERLLEAINYEGLAMVEFRKEQGKPPVFLEINGRLWGSLGLALKAGAVFPRAMVEYHCHQKTSVKQPSLKHKVRWHEPRFDVLYLRSLWSETSKFKNELAPKRKGLVRVALNFINPFVGSDWMQVDEPIQTSKRYLRLIKNQLSQLKSDLVRGSHKQETPSIVLETVNRTQLLREKFPQVKNILFVCYGNICRSSYTEVRWESMRQVNSQLPKSNSVGFHNKVGRTTPARFQSVARYLGVELSEHRSKRVSRDLINAADLLVVMDKRNLEAMHHEFPDAMNKTILLGAVGHSENAEIEDPYGQKIGTGGKIYRRLDAELRQLKTLILQK